MECFAPTSEIEGVPQPEFFRKDMKEAFLHEHDA